MHALRLHGVRDARVDDVPEPALRRGTVKVAVDRAGICGSDLGLYSAAPVPDDYLHPLFDEKGPHVLGHEFAGHVIAVSDDVEGVAVGDLVAVRPNVWDGTCAACLRGEQNLCEHGGFVGINGGGGGFSEYVVVPAAQAFVLPESFTAETGALVESLAVAWHAVRRTDVGPGGSALVIGAGPIGLGLLLSLKAIGVERVFVSELSESRKALAAQLGADVVDPRETDVVDHVRKLTDGSGVDASFDASGVGKATFQPAFDALRNGGTTVVVAQFHAPVEMDMVPFLVTEKKVVGSLAYVDQDFREVIEAVANGTIDPKPLISSTVPLTTMVVNGIDRLLGEGRNSEVKMLVDPTR